MKKIFFTMALVFLVFASNCLAAKFAFNSSKVIKPIPPVSGQFLLSGQNDTGKTFLDMSQPQSEKSKLSMKKALFLSILLPGAGEYYAGSTFKGQVFMGVEAAIWGGFIGYRVYGAWKKDDYLSYASAYGGVNISDKDDVYFDMIGFYDNREEYNQYGRLYHPDRPYYPDADDYDWQWDSEERRLKYKELKDQAKTALRNSTFLIGLAIANRVVSAIDTYRTVKSASKRIRSLTQFGEYHMKIAPKIFRSNPEVKLTLTRKF
ncbi:MAG: DUF5683 domain-containing protein [Candidatus Zixiibacteriota bacterium]